MRVRFNLVQLLRGSGINTGITIKGFKESVASSESRRDRINDIEKAHKLCMLNLI